MLVLIIAASTQWRTGLIHSIPVQAHVMLDYVLAIFLIASPFILGFSDDGTAAAFFIVIGVVHLLLTIATRFVADERPPRAKQAPKAPSSRVRGDRRTRRGGRGSHGRRRGCRRCSTPRRRSRARWRARA